MDGMRKLPIVKWWDWKERVLRLVCRMRGEALVHCTALHLHLTWYDVYLPGSIR